MATIFNICSELEHRTNRCELLRQDGHDVINLDTAESALRALARSVPILIVVDAGLSDMSYLEFCRQLKSVGRTATIPLVAVSANFAHTDHRTSAYEAGIAALLAEPMSSQEFLALINAVLRQHSTRLTMHSDNNSDYLKKVIEQMPVGVIVVEAATGHTLLCSNQVKYTRRSADRAGQESFRLYDGFFPDGRTLQPHNWPLARSLESGETVIAEEISILREDGSQGVISVSSTPVRNDCGEIFCGVLVFEDITERKRTEAALRESEERFLLAARATGDAIWDWDVHTGDMWWNDACFVVFGDRPHSLKSSGQWWIDHIHPLDLEAVLIHSKEALQRNDQSGWVSEYRFQRHDGSYAEVIERAFIVRDRGGKPLRVVGAMMDLTERKRLEADLKEADRRKNEFLAMLAHELRNPLAPLRNAVHVIRHIAGKEAKIDRACQLIDSQVEHCTRLIDDLLDVSRIAQGLITINKEVLRVSEVIENAIEVVKPQLESKQQELHIQVLDEELEVEADGTRLRQILSNILLNASKYSKECTTIYVRACLDVDSVEFRVRDQGVGIARELLPHIFELYVRGPTEEYADRGGLGVGLSLVKRIVDLHGGTVEARSDGIGYGSEFIVRFPHRTARTGTYPRNIGDSAELTHIRVLVVDDNVYVTETLAMVLEMEDFVVDVAATGQKALDLAEVTRPQVAVIDINLTDMDGFAVAAKLRQKFPHESMLLIGLSGSPQTSAAELSQDLNHLLTKPADPKAIIDIINDAFRKHESSR